MATQENTTSGGAQLARELGLLALVATSVCTVIGGGINNLTVEIQESSPGLGPYVPLAFVIGAIPAIATALCYAILATAMPRAGGGYIYISRAVHPFVGFIATFSKWFGLAACVGVISYMDIPLLEAACTYLGDALGNEGAVSSALVALGETLRLPEAKLWVPLGMVWLFWGINVLGVRTYGVTVIVLMFLMLSGGACIIVTGLSSDHQQFLSAWEAYEGQKASAVIGSASITPPNLAALLKATATLFFAYIGFATISQAGGEARDPQRALPKAFVIATVVITGYYLLFAAAVYKAAPWELVTALAQQGDTTAPHILGVLMPAWMASYVALMAALALANDVPPLLLAVSRLFFSWARDGIFPRRLAVIHRKYRTPHVALGVSAIVASGVVLLCHWDQSFIGAVDIINIALLTTYMLACASVIAFPHTNPRLYSRVRFIRSRGAQVALAVIGIISVGGLLAIQFVKQLSSIPEAPVDWLKNPALLWFVVIALGAVVFWVMWTRRARQGWDMRAIFDTLPDEEAEAEDYGFREPAL